MRRTDLQDTHPDLHRRMVFELRRKDPSWKLRKALELGEELKELRSSTRHLRTRNTP